MTAYLADLHLGAKLHPGEYLKTLDLFLQKIKDYKEDCEAIFVCGDMFDKRLNIEQSHFVTVFLMNLVQNRARKDKSHVPVHFVHGTYGHDLDQYNIWLPMLYKLGNITYHATVSTGEVNGKRVLYLPQEYGNKDYSEFFKQNYDIIVGHGPISSKTKEPCPVGNNEILFSAEQLGSISKVCVFGHYHGFEDFGNNVFYAGPWLRWKYGEDEPRVFFFVNSNWEVETIPNPIAKEYKTFEVSDPEELRKLLSVEITTPHRFKIDATDDNLKTFHGIMNTHRKNPNIKWMIKSNLPTAQEISMEYIEKALLDAGAGIGDPIQSLIDFTNERYDVDVSKKIREYDEKIKQKESMNND